MDEGIIKFKSEWKKGSPLKNEDLMELLEYRQKLYDRGLIGVYDNGVGYGNISQRWKDTNQFVISGSGTGMVENLSSQHFTLITSVDIQKNCVSCEGPIIASSESLSHAVIYRECRWVNGIIHVHHFELWEHLLNQLPATAADAAYGTPEMATSIIDLLRTTNLQEHKIFAMKGHEEGVFTFGKDLQEAFEILLKAFVVFAL